MIQSETRKNKNKSDVMFWKFQKYLKKLSKMRFKNKSAVKKLLSDYAWVQWKNKEFDNNFQIAYEFFTNFFTNLLRIFGLSLMEKYFLSGFLTNGVFFTFFPDIADFYFSPKNLAKKVTTLTKPLLVCAEQSVHHFLFHDNLCRDLLLPQLHSLNFYDQVHWLFLKCQWTMWLK